MILSFMVLFQTTLLRKSPPKSAASFTLVELLVVVTIIGFLAGLAVPGISAALGKARDGACLSNLRHIGTAMLSYPVDNNGYLPRGNMNSDGGYEWYKALYNYIPTLNAQISGRQVNKIFLCPSEKQPPTQDTTCCQYTVSFALEAGDSATAVTGTNGNGPRTMASIEAPSKTILMVDGKIGLLAYPYSTESTSTWNSVRSDLSRGAPAQTTKISFRHSSKSGINALYADGHVGTINWSERFDTNKLSEVIWRGRGF